MLGQGKPEKHPVYKFFTNGFVQGIAVFIALAVAFSGKLDSKGTLVTVLVAGVIGAIGIYAHCSNSARQRIVATFSILLYGCALSAFYSYLTSKPTVSAGNTTIQQQDAKPSETKPEEKKPDKIEQDAKKQEPKPKAKAEQPSQGPTVGSITQGPCSNVQVGGSNNTATTNCVPPSRIPSDKQLEDFKSILRDISEPVAIALLAAGSSDDIQPIIDKLRGALHEVKWPFSVGSYGSVTSAGGMPSAEGIECYSTVWATPAAEAFLKAMKAAGLECKKIPRTYPLGSSGITVLIGRQPR